MTDPLDTDRQHGLTREQMAGMDALKRRPGASAEETERALEREDNEAHNEFVARWRGVELMPGTFRQFCVRCGIPFVVTDKRMREKTDLLCDRCPPRSSGRTIASTAFSPDRKMSR